MPLKKKIPRLVIKDDNLSLNNKRHASHSKKTGCDPHPVNADDSTRNCSSLSGRVRDYLWNVLISPGVKIKYESYSRFLSN